jgi:hypothetical protein
MVKKKSRLAPKATKPAVELFFDDSEDDKKENTIVTVHLYKRDNCLLPEFDLSIPNLPKSKQEMQSKQEPLVVLDDGDCKPDPQIFVKKCPAKRPDQNSESDSDCEIIDFTNIQTQSHDIGIAI